MSIIPIIALIGVLIFVIIPVLTTIYDEINRLIIWLRATTTKAQRLHKLWRDL